MPLRCPQLPSAALECPSAALGCPRSPSNALLLSSIALRLQVSAGLSLAGTAMAFTPAMPLGLGLLAMGAGVGVTTATGDAIGQHVQKEELRTRLQQLSQ